MTVVAFLKNHVLALSEYYDVTLVMNTQHIDFAEQHHLPVAIVSLPIERKIDLVADFRVLYQLIQMFKKQRFDLVHSVTPKAGLLAMVAARVVGVGFRIHTFTGQVWVTRRGFSRALLKTMDRILALSATHLLADSFSQRQFLIEQGITKPKKLTVLADGSISGVDTERFKPDSVACEAIRNQLGIAGDDIVLLFLGRLNRDKGVLDLAVAFADIAVLSDRLHLILAGPDEGRLTQEIKQISTSCVGKLHFIDYTNKPEHYFAAADIFCLPSYREGFGSVIIEAAACALPAIGSDIYGISDAIKDGETGLLFPPGNIEALSKAIEQMLVDADGRKRMGQAALKRAKDDFPTKRLVQAWLDYYDGLQ